jgi:phosphatidylserine/phosphatidylglycerophosphate/cardiolipin synthase-like enzyme
MRVLKSDGALSACAISGTRVVLIALDLSEPRERENLRGFAIQRASAGKPVKWLRGLKFFRELVTNPKLGDTYSSREHPVQSLIWGDYEATPDTEYAYTVVALYDDIHHLREGHKVDFKIRTEKPDDGKHGIWFNRGAVASHAFSAQFGNKALTPEMYNDVDQDNIIRDKETIWLSRGLEEACIGYINETPAEDALRVCAYEFTYLPVLNALKAAIKRGVDVKIIYHKTAENDKAIAGAKLPRENLIERTRPPIPHNKFIVRLEGRTKPIAVWTGSTNFTPSGFYGQTNVGHLIHEETTAQKYLGYWKGLSGNPTGKPARESAMALTPNPPNLIPKAPVTVLFSPRLADNMLDWYGQRIEDAANSSMFTAAFTVAPTILRSLAKRMKSVRFVLLESPPTADTKAAQRANGDTLLLSNGAILGQSAKNQFQKQKGIGGSKFVPIPKFALERWFVKEELARKNDQGFVFFLHTKFLLIDPLSDDPLVCTGSANFSANSLTNNDENMLLIRGDTRVADIYMTEFDRIFRHFYFRDVANEQALKGKSEDADQAIFLDTSADWLSSYFKEGRFKNSRRLMFFANADFSWSHQAPNDAEVFGDEAARAKKKRQRQAKSPAKGSTVKKKAPPRKKTAAGKSASKSVAKKARKKSAPKRASPKKVAGHSTKRVSSKRKT